jgi:hypothetical protein
MKDRLCSEMILIERERERERERGFNNREMMLIERGWRIGHLEKGCY